MEKGHEMNKKTLRLIGFVLIFIMLLNLLLFALRRISQSIFWGTILVVGAFTYFILPKLKESTNHHQDGGYKQEIRP